MEEGTIVIKNGVTEAKVVIKEKEHPPVDRSVEFQDEESLSFEKVVGRFLHTLLVPSHFILVILGVQISPIPEVYDALLSKIGFTCRLALIVITSGLGLMSDALEIMSIGFAKAYIAKEFQLTRQEESTLSGVLFAGMLIGGLFWGRCADMFGRRCVLIISLSMNGLSAAVSSLSPTFWLFLVARFFSGIGVGGSLPIIFSYVSEWSSRRVKGGLISTVATCWMAGTIVAAGLAWAILPLAEQPGQFGQSPQSHSSILPESPVFLIDVGRKDEAVTVIRAYVEGVPDTQDEFCVLKRLIEDTSNTTNQRQTFGDMVIEFLTGNVKLFRRRLLKTTLVLMAVILPVHFGYYGFMLWFPEYLDHQSSKEGTIRPPEWIYIESFYVSLASLPTNIFTILLSDKIGHSRLLSASLVLSAGSVFLLWKLDGPDWTVVLSCLFNAVTAPVFCMVDTIVPALYPADSRYGSLMQITFLFSLSGAIDPIAERTIKWGMAPPYRHFLTLLSTLRKVLVLKCYITCSNTWHVIVFTTKLFTFRGTAFGFHTALIRIVSIVATWVFSLFIDSSPTIPILMTAIILLTSAFISLKVPSGSFVH
eukprot:sb/3463272/